MDKGQRAAFATAAADDEVGKKTEANKDVWRRAYQKHHKRLVKVPPSDIAQSGSGQPSSQPVVSATAVVETISLTPHGQHATPVLERVSTGGTKRQTTFEAAAHGPMDNAARQRKRVAKLQLFPAQREEHLQHRSEQRKLRKEAERSEQRRRLLYASPLQVEMLEQQASSETYYTMLREDVHEQHADPEAAFMVRAARASPVYSFFLELRWPRLLFYSTRLIRE